MKVVVAAGGRFHAFHLAQQLHQRQVLHHFFTAAWQRGDELTINQDWASHYHLVSALDWMFFKLKCETFIKLPSWYVFKDTLFDHWLNKQLSSMLDSFDLFVGWTHYWLNSTKVIRAHGAKIVAESGSCHIREQQLLLEEEYARFNIPYTPITEQNAQKMEAEYAEADAIVVPSSFVQQSFIRRGFSAQHIFNIPYGVDYASFYYKRTKPPEQFQAVMVGMVGLQKGIHYLLGAWNKLNLPASKAMLWIVGNIEPQCKELLFQQQHPSITFLGALPRNKLIRYYQNSSVFILPSIQEGLAMVQAEAMASGLPVICTTNTGGSELIEDGKEGFIIPIRNVDALAEKIAWCYEHPLETFEMGLRAQKKARQFTWNHYGDRIIEAYTSIIAGEPISSKSPTSNLKSPIFR